MKRSVEKNVNIAVREAERAADHLEVAQQHNERKKGKQAIIIAAVVICIVIILLAILLPLLKYAAA